MGKTDHQSFEVQVHQNGRWQVHARFQYHDRASAIREAKELSETNSRLAIRVIMEDYYPDTGHHDEVLIFRNRAETTKSSAPQRAQVNWADMAVSSDGRVGFLANEKSDFDHNIDFENHFGRKKTKVSTAMFLVIVFVVIAVGVGFGGVSAGFLFLLIKGFDASLPPSTIKSLMLGLFLLVGFIASISTLNYYRMRYELNLFAKKKKPQAKVTKSKISKQMEKAAEAIDRTPPVEQQHEMEEAKGNIFERENQIPDQVQEQSSDEDGETFGSVAQQQKMFLINYLGAILGALKGPDAPVESLNRFGLNLFMTGSVMRISEDYALNDHEEYTILCRLLEMLGANSDQAERFAMEYEKYLVDERHKTLFEKAGEVVHLYRNKDPFVSDAIRETIENWVNFKKKHDTKNPNQLCVFFTDMVGSTDLTTRHGDYAAQEVLKAHDLIVRTALTNFDGQEIKHLGDGIMASFKDTDKAIDTAIEILKRVEGNNQAGPEFPLHIRIGINVGEPIRKNNDLFGNVVQLASRLCSIAESDNVAVSSFLVEDCGEQTPYTFNYQGKKPLKGFEEPMDVYHLDWKAPPRDLEAIDTSEDDPIEETSQEIEHAEHTEHSDASVEQNTSMISRAPIATDELAPDMAVPKSEPQKQKHSEFNEGLPFESSKVRTDAKEAIAKPKNV